MFLGTSRIAESNGRRGFVLVMMAVSSVALVAIMGLTVDVGRMYVVKNEAQAYADAGALMAARQLNGAHGTSEHRRRRTPVLRCPVCPVQLPCGHQSTGGHPDAVAIARYEPESLRP